MDTILLIAKLIITALGLIIAYLGYLGYLRSNSRPMLFVATGFVFISIGSGCESVLYDIFGVSMFVAGIFQSTLLGVGMVSIIYSIIGQFSA